MEFITKNKYILIIVALLLIYLLFPYLDRVTFFNLDKETILTDAVAVEEAGKEYCNYNACDPNMDLTYDMIKDYLIGLSSEDYYDFEYDGGIIVRKENDKFKVYLENADTGGFEFLKGNVPSESNLDKVVEDLD